MRWMVVSALETVELAANGLVQSDELRRKYVKKFWKQRKVQCLTAGIIGTTVCYGE